MAASRNTIVKIAVRLGLDRDWVNTLLDYIINTALTLGGGGGGTTQNATFTYNTDGQLTRIDYADLTYKDFTYYTNGNLQTIEDGTITKTFTYNSDNELTNITIT